MRWKYGGNGKYEPLPPNIRVVEFDLSGFMANAIRHRRDEDQPDMVGPDTSRQSGNILWTSKTIFVEYFRQGNVKSSESQGRKTTGYDVARDGVDRSVAAIGENPDTD